MTPPVVEIPNVDVLRDVVASVPPSPDHAALRAALQARYPGLSWRVGLYPEEWVIEGPEVRGADGTVIAADARSWLRDRIADAGGDVSAVWEQHRAMCLHSVHDSGTTLFAAAALGERPEETLEVAIDWITATRAVGLLPQDAPRVAGDLLTPFDRQAVALAVPAAPRYRVSRVHHVARMMEQAEEIERARREAHAASHTILVTDVTMDDGGGKDRSRIRSPLDLDPHYLSRPLPIRRFVSDWSTASSGAVAMIDHWAMEVRDYVHDGRRHVTLMPRPLTWGEEILWQESRSLHQLMDLLERYDDAVGHPMAWYFHAVYGNRIGPWAIRDVAEGLRRRKITLPERDAAVVRRWQEQEYSF